MITPRVEGQATWKLQSYPHFLQKNTPVPGTLESPGALRTMNHALSLSEGRRRHRLSKQVRLLRTEQVPHRPLARDLTVRANISIFKNTQGRVTRGEEWAHSNFISKSLPPPLMLLWEEGRQARYRRKKKRGGEKVGEECGRLICSDSGMKKMTMIPETAPRSGKYSSSGRDTTHCKSCDVSRETVFQGHGNRAWRRGTCTQALLISTTCSRTTVEPDWGKTAARTGKFTYRQHSTMNVNYHIPETSSACYLSLT